MHLGGAARWSALALVVGVIFSAGEALADADKYIQRAKNSVEDALDAAEDGRRKCRTAVIGSLKDARTLLSRLRGDASRSGIDRAYGFVAAVAVRAKRTGCPAGVRSEVGRVLTQLNKAKSALGSGSSRRARRSHRSHGSGWRADLRMALDYLADVQDDLDSAPKRCRDGVARNTRAAVRDIRKMARRTTQTELNGQNGFMAGLYLAAKLSSCPSGVANGIHRAHKAVSRAKEGFARGDDDGGYSRRHDDDDDEDRDPCVRYLKKARGAMRSALGAVRSKKVSGKCREALQGNIVHSIREIGDLADDPRQKEIDSHQMFVAGMGLAGAIAECPNSVMSPVARAQGLLTKAKNRAR